MRSDQAENVRNREERILKLSMRDTIRTSKIALPIIALFEVALIVRWIFTEPNKLSAGGMSYLVGYVVLLAVSVAAFALTVAAQRDFEKHVRHVNVVQYVYAVAIVAWSLYFTYVGNAYHAYFNYLTYITVITIVPVFCHVKPVFWIPVQAVSFLCMLWLGSGEYRFGSFAINFLVFIVISMVASCSLYRVRRSAYQSLIEVENESARAHEYAYTDTLTKLPNRRGFREYVETLREGETPRDLAVVMFDVDYLKTANDLMGHETGDELLVGAAECMRRAFSPLGEVYRVGGDEFIGVLFGSEHDVAQAVDLFCEEMRAWRGTHAHGLSVSMGVASAVRFPEASLDELLSIADKRMYEDKERRHQERGRQESAKYRRL